MEENNKATWKQELQSAFQALPHVLNKIIQFGGIIVALGLVIMSLLTLYKVALEEKVVRDVEGPVARYTANVDFSKRSIAFDTTFSKTKDANSKITIWRMGDGHVYKSSTPDEIAKHETLEYTFSTPGTYTIGYSIIDMNDLSDEATCTISFKDDTNPKSTNYVSSDCGKSDTSYQNINSVYTMNYTRDRIRTALMSLGIAVMTLFGVFMFKIVFERFFEK